MAKLLSCYFFRSKIVNPTLSYQSMRVKILSKKRQEGMDVVKNVCHILVFIAIMLIVGYAMRMICEDDM